MKLLLFLTAGVCAFAHDMWIEPATFRPQAGEIVAIRLRVGQEMLGDPIPYSAQLAKRFNSTAGKLVAREGNDPAGLLRIEEAGLAIVTYFSNASSVEQAPEKFAAYVKEEGLEGIAARRDGKNVRELFTRLREVVGGDRCRPGSRGGDAAGVGRRGQRRISIVVAVEAAGRGAGGREEQTESHGKDHGADGRGWSGAIGIAAWRDVDDQSGSHGGGVGG
ncbi:MAG: hypothetical protein WDO18_03090 [Acidobacteriota bacterium]